MLISGMVVSERTGLKISVWQWAGRYFGGVASVFARTRGAGRSCSHSFRKQIFTFSPAHPSCAPETYLIPGRRRGRGAPREADWRGRETSRAISSPSGSHLSWDIKERDVDTSFQTDTRYRLVRPALWRWRAIFNIEIPRWNIKRRVRPRIIGSALSRVALLSRIRRIKRLFKQRMQLISFMLKPDNVGTFITRDINTGEINWCETLLSERGCSFNGRTRAEKSHREIETIERIKESDNTQLSISKYYGINCVFHITREKKEKGRDKGTRWWGHYLAWNALVPFLWFHKEEKFPILRHVKITTRDKG